MSHFPLNALRAFEAVVRMGSSKNAAASLAVTPSAVSHQIRHLEDWLGAPLFDRRGGRPRLLPHGEEFARGLTIAFEHVHVACERARRAAGPRTLVVAAIPSVAIYWLIPRLPRFRAAHPDVTICVVYAMHDQEIDFREVDAAFVYAAAEPRVPGVQAEVFLPGESMPVCGGALASRFAAGPADARAILDAGLLHDSDHAGWRGWLSRAGTAPPATLDGPVFEDFNLLRAAALCGQGVALCPTAMIQSDLDDGHLVRLSNVSVLEDHHYYLLTTSAVEAVAEFRDWAVASCLSAPR